MYLYTIRFVIPLSCSSMRALASQITDNLAVRSIKYVYANIKETSELHVTGPLRGVGQGINLIQVQ